MKSNTRVSHRIAALLLAALLLFGMALTASAATYQAGDNVRIYHDFALPFKLKERNAEGFPWMATGYLTNALVPPTGASWVYCIDYWHSASGGTYTTTDLMQTPAWTSLSFVARKGITHAMIYGCPNNGRNDIYGYAATQLIIWEYQLGQRSNASQTVTYFSSTLSQNATLRSIYISILSSMAAHDVLPSFDGQSVTLQGYGRENGVTLTDTNGKLANDSWTIATGSGFHVEQNGNNLLIYADSSVAADSTTTVTLKRNLNVVTGTALGITVGAQKAILGVPPDPVSAALSVKMEAKADLEIIKTSTDGKVSGISFEIEQFVPGIGWCSIGTYETNSSGKINLTDYDVGTQLRVTEIVPAGYVCTSQNPQTITLVSGTNRLTFTNEPTVGLEIVKTCSDGKINNISFKVEQYEASGGIGWWEMGTYQTDANGKITVDDLDIGTKLRVTEIVPSGYVCNSTNPQTITLKAGTNKLTFENEPLPKLEIIKSCSDGKINGISFKVERKNGSSWAVLGTYTTDSAGKITIPNLTKGQQLRVTEIVPEGYTCNSQNPQTITLAAGTNRLSFENEPLPKLEIIKTCSDGKINGISFTVERSTKSGWVSVGTYTTDSAGKITIPNLTKGQQLRVTEIVPEGYVCNSQNPQTITLASGTNRLTFENEPLADLEIVKISTDGKIKDISFKVEQYEPEGGIGWWLKGTYQTDASGKINIDGLRIGTKLRVTEIVPDGYFCNSVNPQEITLVAGKNTLTFRNEPYVTLDIVKQCVDGKIDGISFYVERSTKAGWKEIGTYITDAKGKVSIPNLKRSWEIRVTETVPEGYICTSENPQTITLTAGTNVLTFVNEPLSDLVIIKICSDGNIKDISFKIEQYEPEGGIGWWEKGTYTTDAEGKIALDGLRIGTQLRVTELVPEGYVCLSDNPQEITLASGTNTLTFENEPLASLEIIKTSTDGKVDGISFLIEKYIGRRWRALGTYETNADGKIEILELNVGSKIRVTERVPENYICLSENPQVLTLATGTNTVSFENKPIVRLELVKESDDGNVDGIEFALSVKRNRLFVDIGTYVTQDGGKIIVEELEIGKTYRLTEHVPTGYIGEAPVQEFTAQIGTNTLTFVNRLIRGSLRIVKVDKTTQTPLEGAGYRLLNADGEEIATGYTDENGELSFEDLPYGEYSYQEFEAPSGFVLDDTVYTLSITQDGVEIAKRHENEIIPGSILIKKVDENNRALPGVAFLLEFSVNDGETWTPVFDRNESDPVQAGGCTSENLHHGKLTTGQKGQVLFSGLCVDTQLGTVRYRLTEVSTVDGYNLLAEPVFEGSLQPGEELDLSFTVVNTPTFKMPATGGSGFSLTALCMALSAIAAVLFMVWKRKQRN